MAITVASGNAFSVAANTVSAEQVSGMYQYIGKGRVTLVATTSATGMYLTLSVNGIPLIQDQASPYVRATANLSVNDHVVVSQVIKQGGFVSFKLRNSTAGALTSDYMILYEPM